MQSNEPFAHRARILCVPPLADETQALTKALDNAGYAICDRSTGAFAEIGLIDLRGATYSLPEIRKLASNSRRIAPDCSIIFVADLSLSAKARNEIRRLGEIVILEDETDANALIIRMRQILRLRNIAEETGERLKSLTTLNRLADFPPILTSANDARILIGGAPGPSALAAGKAADAIKACCVSVLSAGQAMRALEHENFDAAVFIAQSTNDSMMSLARALRRHPKHGAMPVICPFGELVSADELSSCGAQDFIYDHYISDDLPARLQLSIRRGRLMRAMRRFLSACTGEGVRDAASGAFTAAFFAEHGARLCARADQTGRPLSFAAVSFSGATNTEARAKPKRAALMKAVRLINRITRAEDMIAHIANGVFIVAMPATTPRDARLAGLRIDGVLSNSVFKEDRSGTPFSINTDLAVFQHTANGGVEDIVSKAIKSIRALQEDQATQPRRQSPL